MPDETAVDPDIRGEVRSRRVDESIAALAGHQHGVVGRAQLRELGIGGGGIDHRVQSRRLHPIHRGVYAVGHTVLTAQGRWMGAVLAAGPGAVLSHRSAAVAWEVLGSTGSAIEATVPRKARSRSDLIVRHRRLPADETTLLDAVPMTTVPRTLFDLAAIVPRHLLRHAINEAEYLHLRDPLSIVDMLERYPRHRGVRVLRSILAERGPRPVHTRSELEDRFLEFVRGARLPVPSINALVELPGGVIEADCVWWSAQLIVELDGRAAHDTASGFERDRVRDRDLLVAGWRVVRVTWRQLHERPVRLAADLRALLDASRLRRA